MPNPLQGLKDAKAILNVEQYSGLTPRERHERGDDVNNVFYPLRDGEPANSENENAVAREIFGIGNDVQIPTHSGMYEHLMGPYPPPKITPDIRQWPPPLHGLQKAHK